MDNAGHAHPWQAHNNHATTRRSPIIVPNNVRYLGFLDGCGKELLTAFLGRPRPAGGDGRQRTKAANARRRQQLWPRDRKPGVANRVEGAGHVPSPAQRLVQLRHAVAHRKPPARLQFPNRKPADVRPTRVWRIGLDSALAGPADTDALRRIARRAIVAQRAFSTRRARGLCRKQIGSAGITGVNSKRKREGGDEVKRFDSDR